MLTDLKSATNGTTSIWLPRKLRRALGGSRFLNALRATRLAVSLGGTESLAEHPATMTHADIPRERQEQMEIGAGLVRLSVGLEHPHALVADVGQALEAAGCTGAAACHAEKGP